MDEGVISTFKSYYLRITFYKAIAAIDSYSPNGSWQSKLQTFWRGPTILDAIKNIRDSWEEVKISTLTGVWKKLIPTLMNEFEGFKILEEEVTADVVEIARQNYKWSLKMGLTCFSLMIKVEQMKSCFLWMNRESGFLRWSLLPEKMP